MPPVDVRNPVPGTVLLHVRADGGRRFNESWTTVHPEHLPRRLHATQMSDSAHRSHEAVQQVQERARGTALPVATRKAPIGRLRGTLEVESIIN